MNIVIVTGAIAPYTNRLYDAVGRLLVQKASLSSKNISEALQETSCRLHVLTCTEMEPHRKWALPDPEFYTLSPLRGYRVHRSDHSHIYFNPAVFRALWKRKPDLVLLDGFSPTMMFAAAYARMTGTPMGILTDGTDQSDPGTSSRLHRWMRKLLVPGAKVGIGASEGSRKFLESYGLTRDKYMTVPIVTTWEPLENFPDFEARKYDLLFCGALNDEFKGAQFFTDMVCRCHAQKPDLKVRIVGEGPLRFSMEQQFGQAGVDVRFEGFLQAEHLPEIYASARLFLFPSRIEPWGLVANEALLSGTPVLASPHVAAGLYLIDRFKAGRVLPFEKDVWVREVLRLLGEEGRQDWLAMQSTHKKAAQWFSLERSAARFERAIELGLSGK